MIVRLKGYKTKGDMWIFDVYIESSTAESDLKKNQIVLDNSVMIGRGKTVLLGLVDKKLDRVSFLKGIPYLSRLPLLGSLFTVRSSRVFKSKIVIFLSLEPVKSSDQIKSLWRDPEQTGKPVRNHPSLDGWY